MMVAANAWINHFHAIGVSVENAIEAIALNGDRYPGLVALALEAALVSQKPRGLDTLRITVEQYSGLVERLYSGDVGGIYTLMHHEWDFTVKTDAPPPEVHRTRSQWRQELGHDVLIHPANLQPIRDTSLGYLEYLGMKAWDGGAEMTFRMPGGELLVTQRFPEQYRQAD